MAPDLEITIDSADWRTVLPEAEDVVRRAAAAALAAAGPGLPAAAELSILLTSDDTARRLNRDYRGKDAPTNVLAFANAPAPSSAGQPMLLGDVVLALGVLLNEAECQRKRPADHLSHLVVHGVLHLLGHDHEGDTDAAIMENLEIEILARIGVANPYVGPEERRVPQEVVKA